tara:strand:- start:131 stop:406 length:276 start_codon:yes stop_codon:yes gene_type:complete
MTDAKKTPKNIVNRKFVRVKGPTIMSLPSSIEGEMIDVIMDRHWMEPLTKLAEECNTNIRRWISIEDDSDILLEFDTSKQALIYALHYEDS